MSNDKKEGVDCEQWEWFKKKDQEDGGQGVWFRSSQEGEMTKVLKSFKLLDESQNMESPYWISNINRGEKPSMKFKCDKKSENGLIHVKCVKETLIVVN